MHWTVIVLTIVTETIVSKLTKLRNFHIRQSQSLWQGLKRTEHLVQEVGYEPLVAQLCAATYGWTAAEPNCAKETIHCFHDK